jgi:hypothetical protein
LDRKLLGPTGNSVVLWLLLLAETGAGKQHGLNCLRIMLRAMGVEDTFVASGLGSVQGIEEILRGTATIPAHPNALVVIDEVGAWLKRISSGGQTGNVAEIPALLQSLWGHPPQLPWTGSKTKGQKMDEVHGPAFSLYGVSTEGKFIKALTGEQVSNGFVNRMLLANIGRGCDIRAKTKYEWTSFPGWLATALKEVAGPKAPDGPIRLELAQRDGSVVVLRDFRGSVGALTQKISGSATRTKFDRWYRPRTESFGLGHLRMRCAWRRSLQRFEALRWLRLKT